MEITTFDEIINNIPNMDKLQKERLYITLKMLGEPTRPMLPKRILSIIGLSLMVNSIQLKASIIFRM